jgi:hypothetical protein
MAESVALWGRDIDESPADLDDTYISDGRRDPITEPIPVVSDVFDGYDVQNRSIDREENVRVYAESVIDRRPSAGSTLTFKPAPAPWYRTKRGLIVLIAVIAVAAVLAIVPMLLRTPGSAPEEPTNMTPTTGSAPSSAPPTTGSVVPTLTSQPAPPPAPPPPPPAAQDAPVYVPQYQSPRGGSAAEAHEPQIGVTRAPISVAPKPVTPPSTAEVGDNGGNSTPRRRWHW